MIYARMRLGSTEYPTYRMVRIIDQCMSPPLGRYEVIDLESGDKLYPYVDALQIFWWEEMEKKKV